MIEEMFRLGLPTEAAPHMGMPISIISSCAMQLHSINVMVKDAISLVDLIVMRGPDEPYWFESETDPKSDRIRYVEQAMRTLRGAHIEVVDILVDGNLESRAKAADIVKFIIEFIYLALADQQPRDMPPAG